MSNFKQVSIMLSRHVDDVVRYLLPQGKKNGNEWCVGSISGGPGKSLKVHLSGDKAGVWSDFATGDSGDLLDLWSLNRQIPLMAALKEASDYLGVVGPKFEGYKPRKFVRPSINKVVPVTSSSPTMNYLTIERKLTVETIRAFKIGERGRSIVCPYWRNSELIFIKYIGLDRIDGKKQIFSESNCEPCLFGWQALAPNTRRIVITEGEIDAMSLYQYGLPSLSLPLGGGTGKKHEWVEYEYDRLSIFDEIFLCLDNDDKGQAAVADLIERLGRHRCRIVTLPYKDANECLQKGITTEEMHKCFAQARTLDPEELKSASLYVDQVIDEFYPKEGTLLGYNPPWQYAKGKILFRPDELSVWTGICGHGKSQFLGQIILSAMRQDARVCIASLEIKPKKLLMRLTRQAAGCDEPEENYIRAIHDWYGDKLWLFDLVGTAKADRLLEVFLYARQRYGVDVFVIDSFMKLGVADDDYKAQKVFIEKICDFKNQYNCHVHIVVHPRKAEDETQIPGKLDCKGSSAITDLADNCFVIWRNKKKEEIMQMKLNGVPLSPDQLKRLEESDCVWRCDKQRNGDWEGKIGLWFHRASYQYLSQPNHKPQFIEYSNVYQSVMNDQ